MTDQIVRAYMTRKVTTVTENVSLLEVARLMRDERLSCLLVVRDGIPVGILTERDFVRLSAGFLTHRNVGNLSSIMSSGLISISADAGCDDAVLLLARNRVRRLIVVEKDGSFCGLITRSDLLRAHTTEIEQQKQYLEQRVLERTKELDLVNKKLKALSLVDPMLEIGNRRSMDIALAELFHRTVRYTRPYSMALVDIDYFKLFNDYYGHPAGDRALISVANAIKKVIRRTDMVFRYGGEEFLVLLPEVGVDGGTVAAEHIRVAIEKLDLPHDKSPHNVVTISIGVAEESLASPDQVHTIAIADSALYKAKRNGRNRVATGCEQDLIDYEEGIKLSSRVNCVSAG